MASRETDKPRGLYKGNEISRLHEGDIVFGKTQDPENNQEAPFRYAGTKDGNPVLDYVAPKDIAEGDYLYLEGNRRMRNMGGEIWSELKPEEDSLFDKWEAPVEPTKEEVAAQEHLKFLKDNAFKTQMTYPMLPTDPGTSMGMLNALDLIGGTTRGAIVSYKKKGKVDLAKSFDAAGHMDAPEGQEVLSAIWGDDYDAWHSKTEREFQKGKNAYQEEMTKEYGKDFGGLMTSLNYFASKADMAGLVAEVATDPLTYVGVGIAKSLMKTGKKIIKKVGRKGIGKQTFKQMANSAAKNMLMEESSFNTLAAIQAINQELSDEAIPVAMRAYITDVKLTPAKYSAKKSMQAMKKDLTKTASDKIDDLLSATQPKYKAKSAYSPVQAARSDRGLTGKDLLASPYEQGLAVSGAGQDATGALGEAALPQGRGRSLLNKRETKIVKRGNAYVRTEKVDGPASRTLVSEKQMWGDPVVVTPERGTKQVATTGPDGRVSFIEEIGDPTGVDYEAASKLFVSDFRGAYKHNKKMMDTIDQAYQIADNMSLPRASIDLMTPDDLNNFSKILRTIASGQGEVLVDNFEGGMVDLFRMFANPKNVLAKSVKESGKVIGLSDKGNIFTVQMNGLYRDLKMRGHKALEKRYGSMKKPAFKEAESRVYKALADRSNKFKYLKNSADEEAYAAVLELNDTFKGIREKRGMTVLENYATEMNPEFLAFRDKQLYEAIENPKNLDNMVGDWLNEQNKINARSVYSKERKGLISEPSTGLWSEDNLGKYARSQIRELGYSDFVKEFSSMRKTISDTTVSTIADKWAKNLVKPDYFRPNRIGRKVAGRAYKGFVKWNAWASAVNTPQARLAKLRVSGDAIKYSEQLYGSKIGAKLKLTGKPKTGYAEVIDDFFADVAEDHSSWMHMLGEEYAMPRETFGSKGIFGVSELRNWTLSRTWGRMEQMTQEPVFLKFMKESGGDVQEALVKTLDSPTGKKIAQRAKVRGEQLAADSQIEMGSIAEPYMISKIREIPVVGAPMAQFTRFPMGAAEFLVNSVTESGRIAAVVRRGFGPEATAAEGLKAMNLLEQTTKRAVKSAKGIDVELGTAIMNEIKADKATFVKAIKAAEKREPLRNALNYGIYTLEGAALTALKWHMTGKIYDKLGMKKPERTAWDLVKQSQPYLQIAMSPASIFEIAAAPAALQPGSGQYDRSPRYMAENTIRKAMQLAPITGPIDSNTGGALSKYISESLIESVFGPKKGGKVGGL